MSLPAAASPRSGALVVITDLDGCLLDSETYAYDAARPALAALARAGQQLVLCSGKTRAEMGLLVRLLGLAHPFIVENGGAIVFPPGSFDGDVPGARELEGQRILELGPPRWALIAALREIAAEAGAAVRGFADMSSVELIELTGLSGPAAQLALEREYDEPFLLEGGEEVLAALGQVGARRGLQISHGGRFHHLMGGSDKGLAVRTLLALYTRAGRDLRSAGLGDAETDLPLLRAVERPIVVPRRDGSIDPALASHLPGAEHAPAPGPSGWNAAVLALLEGRRLPHLGDATERGEA